MLLLDVARFKYPCHWVPLPLLYKAMAEYIDDTTGKQRGYFCMERPVSGGCWGGLRCMQSIDACRCYCKGCLIPAL